MGRYQTFGTPNVPSYTLHCGLTICTKTAFHVLGELGLDRLAIDTLCAEDSKSKYLNIAADASAVNKLAAKTVTHLRGELKSYRTCRTCALYT